MYFDRYLFNSEAVDLLSRRVLQRSLYSRAASRPPLALETTNIPSFISSQRITSYITLKDRSIHMMSINNNDLKDK